MTELMQASNQWASRPDDERFCSLVELQEHTQRQRVTSHQHVINNRYLLAAPDPQDEVNGLVVGAKTPNGVEHTTASHWSFNQLSQLAGAPAGYLRTLPAPMVADCLNYGLTQRSVEDVQILTQNGTEERKLKAVTGPNYGRVWNNDLVSKLVQMFGDGVSGDWKVPGEFGKDVPVTKANTTIYASDRDMFVFLANEHNRIDVPNRRDGSSGSMARGFFVWNSEVGSTSLGASFFLFDYVCCNRIVWGARDVQEIRLRHTSGAPMRWLEEIEPVLLDYADAATSGVVDTIKSAQAKKLDDTKEFLAKRFTKSQTSKIFEAFEIEENKPIETAFDAVTGITAYAKTIPHQQERVAVEREAGKILNNFK